MESEITANETVRYAAMTFVNAMDVMNQNNRVDAWETLTGLLSTQTFPFYILY